MKKIVVYTLEPDGNLGCFPACHVVDVDDENKFLSAFVTISKSNIKNYKYHFDELDELLIQLCFQLDRNTIIQKINHPATKSRDKLINNFFGSKGKKLSQQDEYIKNYIIDYLNNYLNKFFSLVAEKPLYLLNGRFPFSWLKLNIQEEIPELFYRFENVNKELTYSLLVSASNRKLSLTNAILISRDRARILIKNSIYEFESYVNGIKLVPFFNKDVISISSDKKQEYVTKVILPLVETNRVIPQGFEIQTLTEVSQIILRVKESHANQQFSLFETNNTQALVQDITFELIFKYQDFSFRAGQKGKLTEVKYDGEDFIIFHVHRDFEAEEQYILEFGNLGFNLRDRIRKISYYEGIEWLNTHNRHLESLGVDIQFQRKSTDNPVFFIGDREISVQLNEEKDWFDIRGKVRFGVFEFPLVLILNYMKQNKRMILLPNGEFAQIPQSWFDEYLSLAEFIRNEHGHTVFPKQFVVVADALSAASKIKLTLKTGLRKLLEKDFKDDFDLPLHFNGQLRSYQLDGYKWLRILDELHLGGCLADDMGLGKTIQTLCLIQWLKENKRGKVLLVVPTSLIYNWQQEASKFTPDISIAVHTGSGRSKTTEEWERADIILTSYAILRRDRDLFASYHFEYVILDEAQAIKNPQSDITQVCLTLQSNHYLTLTGTPIENSLSDLWSQVHFFSRNMLGSVNHFMQACKKPEKIELYRNLLKPFLLRRHKTEVLKDLPEKNIIVQYCDMGDEQKKFYRELRNSYREKFLEKKNRNEAINPVILLEGLLRLRQAANHPVLIENDYVNESGKFNVVVEMMMDVINQGDKILIFSSFVEHLKLYKAYLDEQEIAYAYLDGHTKDRASQVESFQHDVDVKVFLLSLKAGGTGLNLTSANYVFLLDPWWNPAAEMQAFDRAHRIGQQKSVFVYKFIAIQSIEEKIYQLQKQKISLSESMLDNDNNLLKALNTEEILELIGN